MHMGLIAIPSCRLWADKRSACNFLTDREALMEMNDMLMASTGSVFVLGKNTSEAMPPVSI